MATRKKCIEIPNRLKSLNGNIDPAISHIVAGADDIYDDVLKDVQSAINAEILAELSNRYTKGETYSREDFQEIASKAGIRYVNTCVTEEVLNSGSFDFYYDVLERVIPAESTEETGVIYRVGCWDGLNERYDVSKYSEYVLDVSGNPILISVVDHFVDVITNEEMDSALDGEGSDPEEPTGTLDGEGSEPEEPIGTLDGEGSEPEEPIGTLDGEGSEPEEPIGTLDGEGSEPEEPTGTLDGE